VNEGAERNKSKQRGFRTLTEGGIMENIIGTIDPDYLLYGGAIGIFLGLLFFIFFLFRRIRWFFRLLSRKGTISPRILASLRNLLLILFWTAFFGMSLFLGFFLRSYHAFTYEKPVAEIRIQPFEKDKLSQITLIQFLPQQGQTTQQFFLRGDQWMLEGDIVKVSTMEEVQAKKTIYSLVEQENHPFWQYLYQYGHRLPFVSTVYGNAVFQVSREERSYLIYVGTSGFIVRKGKG
jgi:hypothetical protein